MLSAVLVLTMFLSPGCGGEAPEPVAIASPLDWPRAFPTDDGGEVVFHAPQITSWAGQKRISALFAVAVHPENAFGTVVVEGETAVDRESHQVLITGLTVTDATFPSADPSGAEALRAEVASVVPSQVLSTVENIAAYVDSAEIAEDHAGIATDAPPIFWSSAPAALMQFDGDPILAPVQGTSLQFAVNTNWDVLFDGTAWYARLDESWWSAPAAKGPWAGLDKAPASFAALASDPQWADAVGAIPGKRAPALRIFVSMRPAELILLDGEPSMTPIPGTSLLYVTNTDSDLFFADGQYWFLVAGRWFRAPSLDGPWTFATLELPADFAKIPEDHPRGRVLASVPGTPQAEEAVILAQTPETATVERTLAAPEVVYAGGTPALEPIEGTSVERVANTEHQILVSEGRYYMCEDAVWFASDGPDGPWAVTDTIPAEFANIPASSPSYEVTNVTVVESDTDSVTFAYTAAYVGLFVLAGVCVWGSGWYYPPYAHYWHHPYYGPHYPFYAPYPHTYGMGAWYNPATGAYGRRAVAYGPYGGAARSAAYNPRTGTYARGASVWGPYGAHGAASAYNPRTNTWAGTSQHATPYGRWGTSAVRHGNDWVQTGHAVGDDGAAAGYRTSDGDAGFRAVGEDGAIAARRQDGSTGFVARNDDGDLYAGRDGNVYRRTEDGGWESAGEGGWEPVERPDGGARPDNDLPGGDGGIERPSTGVERPSTGVERPSTGVERPSTGVERPASGVDRPSAQPSIERPATGTDRPSTQPAIDQPAVDRSGLEQPRSIMDSRDTYGQLDRDHSSREFGDQRSGSWQTSRGSSGISRGGGVSRGGRR